MCIKTSKPKPIAASAAAIVIKKSAIIYPEGFCVSVAKNIKFKIMPKKTNSMDIMVIKKLCLFINKPNNPTVSNIEERKKPCINKLL